MDNKFCVYCGNALTEGAMFCPHCGNPVGAQQQPVQPQYYSVVKPKVPGRGFGISSMVLGIIGVFYSFIYLLSSWAFKFAGSYLETYGNELNYGAFNQYGTEIDMGVEMGMELATGSLVAAAVFFSIFSILSLIFALNARKRGYVNGISLSGLILSSAGLIACVASIFILLVV